MRTYRNHNCPQTHADLRSFTRCAVPGVEWVTGTGEFAVIAWCKPTTVTLFATEADALAGSYAVGRRGCGPNCRGRHDLYRMNPRNDDEATTPE